MISSLKALIPVSLKDYLKRLFIDGAKNSPEDILKNYPRYKQGSYSLYNKEFRFVDACTFIYGKSEIIDQEIYKFQTDKKNPIIIDCGANIGLSVLYFKMNFPNSTVIAFEPDSTIFEVLSSNVEQYNLKNVDLRNTAIWTENGELQFRREGGFSGRIALPGDDENVVKVKTERLYDLLVDEIDFLKIDIEGAEIDVLKDCEPRLCNVERIFIEYHSHIFKEQELDELLGLLTRNGFRYFIDKAFCPAHPYLTVDTMDNMDLQLNIFAVRK